MRTNLLKLNDYKTKFMLIGTRQQLHKVGKLMIEIGQDTIVNTPSARNLSFDYDEELKKHNSYQQTMLWTGSDN